MKTNYRISDGNAVEYAADLSDAAEIAAGWYNYLADRGHDVGCPDLDSSSLDALNKSIRRWENQIAEAAGRKAFAGHGSYHVSAADAMGLRLRVETEEN
jgi:hypothetical protein